MKILGYVRTSTDEQNNGLDAQIARLRIEAADRGWELTIISEQASGKTLARRPQLQAALGRLSAGDCDGLVVTKLDRLARSVLDFSAIIEKATSEKWALICLDLALDTSTPNGRFTAHVLAAVAQLERDLISQRTKEALSVVRARGVQLGRHSDLSAEQCQNIKQLRDNGASWRAIATQIGVAMSSVRRAYHRTNLTPPRH